jgi:hypothetical protein
METISPTEEAPKAPVTQEATFPEKIKKIQSINSEIKRLIAERDALVDWNFEADGKAKASFSKDPRVAELNTKMLNLIQEAKIIIPDDERAEFIKKCFALGTPGENEVGNFVLRELPAMPQPQVQTEKPKKKFFGMFG